jgi:hypothetical protein
LAGFLSSHSSSSISLSPWWMVDDGWWMIDDKRFEREYMVGGRGGHRAIFLPVHSMVDSGGAKKGPFLAEGDEGAKGAPGKQEK